MAAPTAPVPPAQAGERAQDSVIININGKAIRQWPRDKWLEAMWECVTLTPNERVVGHVFARYAGKTDISWCQWDELVKRTGIKSKTTISKVITRLVNGGWLAEHQPARQHFSARYRLTVPGGGDDQTSTDWMSERARRTRDGRLRGSTPAPDVQDMDVPDIQHLDPDIQSAYPSTQTEPSDLQPGGTLPPDPLRPEHAPRTRNEQDQLLTLVVPINETKEVTSRTRTRADQTDRPLIAIVPDPPAHEIDDQQLELLDPAREEQWAAMHETIAQLTAAPTGAAS